MFHVRENQSLPGGVPFGKTYRTREGRSKEIMLADSRSSFGFRTWTRSKASATGFSETSRSAKPSVASTPSASMLSTCTPQCVLNSRTTTSERCEAVPRRAHS